LLPPLAPIEAIYFLISVFGSMCTPLCGAVLTLASAIFA
jgi:hypothetical protein